MPKLEAYDETGKVIATLDYLVTRTPKGKGLVAFEEHVKAGRKLRRIWDVEKAVGSRVAK